MNFCKAYNKMMKRLNEFNEPVSEINIFIGIVNLMEQLFWHIFIYGLCCMVYLFEKLIGPFTIIENRTHIYKTIIGPILDWYEQIEHDIIYLVQDAIHSVTTSKCTKKK